jgi:HPt (histidine-containing phosphotransfer) domain-containing protein
MTEKATEQPSQAADESQEGSPGSQENLSEGELERRDITGDTSSDTGPGTRDDASGGASGTSQHREAGRVSRPRYSREQIELGLRAVALANGNNEKASRELAKQGVKIPARTLWGWSKEDHVQRYREIQAEVVPEIHARLAEQTEALAAQHGEVEANVLKRLKKELPNVPVRDLSTAARNLATGRGISTDLSRKLRGTEPQPRNVIEEADEIQRALERLGLKLVPHVPNLEEEPKVLDAEAIEEDEG